MELATLSDLLRNNLYGVVEAERSLCTTLSAITPRVSSDELRELLAVHQNDMRKRVARLERLVSDLGFSGDSHISPSVGGLLAELCSAAASQGDEAIRDISILGVMCRLKQHHIAACEIARSLAEVMELPKQSRVFFEHLVDDQRVEASLTVLLEDFIDTAYETGLYQTDSSVILPEKGVVLPEKGGY